MNIVCQMKIREEQILKNKIILENITKNIKGRKTFIEYKYFIKNSWIGKRFQCV